MHFKGQRGKPSSYEAGENGMLQFSLVGKLLQRSSQCQQMASVKMAETRQVEFWFARKSHESLSQFVSLFSTAH